MEADLFYRGARPAHLPEEGSTMRIGLIAPPGVPVPPPAYGGTESVIDLLARGLVRTGHEVLLAAAANSSCPVPLVEGGHQADEAEPVCADSITELRHVISGYAAMSDVDVIHDHTMIGPLYGHRPMGTPVVTTAHGPFNETLGPVYGAMRGLRWWRSRTTTLPPPAGSRWPA
jgi:hypothetical protein